ncbi:MAG: RNA-guided endonuclease InsQ/TnpB family protein [Candidatus Hermodarchaeota archaeon]
MRRLGQRCRVYQLKVDKSHLSNKTRAHLQQLFRQAKWLSNDILASEDLFTYDTKVKAVNVKVGEHFESRYLDCLSSQMKQGLLSQIQADVRNLAKKKAKGQKVGRLKFKKYISTIPLKQYGKTYRLHSAKNRVYLQGLKSGLRVRGFNQIPAGAEFANAKILHKHGDFYVHVTTYVPKTPQQVPPSVPSVGLDFGIKHQLTLSNAVRVDYTISPPQRLRRLNRRLSKAERGSHKYYKTRVALQKAFRTWANRKTDVTNKLTHILTTHFPIICFQDETIAHWQQLWGRHVCNTNLGALLTNLKKRSVTPVVVTRWSATTKRCVRCAFVLDSAVPLSQRVFRCPRCGHTGDRDVNAAQSIEQLGLDHLSLSLSVPAGCREVTPLEIHISTLTLVDLFNQVSFVRASIVDERGSLIASA